MPERFNAISWIQRATADGREPLIIFAEDGRRWLQFEPGWPEQPNPRRDRDWKAVGDALVAMGRFIDVRKQLGGTSRAAIPNPH